MSATSPDISNATAERILDAAEELFSERGYDAASLRAITELAVVNLAAVHYHFGSKEALLKAIFSRRLRPMNAARLAALGAAERRAGAGPLPLVEVVRAFVEPALQMSRDPRRGGAACMRLCGRFFWEARESLRPFFEDEFRAARDRFAAAFARALPAVTPPERFWRVHFALGALVHTMVNHHLLAFVSGGLCDPGEVEQVTARLTSFIAGGMAAAPPTARAANLRPEGKDAPAPG